MMKGLKGKTAIVTGSARGIGKGIAENLCRRGCRVVVADVLYEEARQTAQELTEKYDGEARAWKINLLEEKQIEQMMDEIHHQYGSIDILVNNAGITVREAAMEISSADFERVLGVNLKSYYLASRCAARYMKDQETRGSIICISSCNSEHYTSRRSPYNISKAAVNGLIGTLGVEWGRLGIRINGVAPGYVLTNMVQEGINQGIIEPDKIMTIVPMKRFLSQEEIGNAVSFLASDEASGITGQTLFVDGGWSKCGLPEE